MSLTPETSTALITSFKGSSQGVDPYDIDSAHGLLCINCDFVVGQNESVQAGTRFGTQQVSQIPNGAGAITTIASWFFSFQGNQNCYLAMYSPAIGLLFYDQAINAFSGAIVTVTGAAYMSIVFDGVRALVAFGDATGRNGVSQGYIYTLFANNTFAFPAVDALFPPAIGPSVATVSAAATASGVVTAGTHRIGFIYTSRNGAGTNGPLNPVNSSGVFAPVTFTAADNAHNAMVSIVWSTIPSYLSPIFAPVAPTIQIVMTTAANLNEYYLVPGATAVVGAVPFTMTIPVNIDDADLATGTNATQFQNAFTQGIGFSGPFNPSAIFPYSSRMGYCTLDPSGFPVVFFSDQNNYQSLTLAFSGVYLESRQIPVQGCSLGGVCYIATLSALYAIQDNGGQPATWTPAARVDGSVGILSPTCLLAVGGKILLASEKGLYIYRGGVFPKIPVSYYQDPDWNRINWLAPTQVQVVDDAHNYSIRVIAPLSVVVVGASNTSPITITTAVRINDTLVQNPHLFQTGLSVTISGVGGNTAANATSTITVTGPNTFTIPIAGNGNYTSGGLAAPNTANAEMAWVYPEGDSPGEPFYSLNAFSSYRQGSMATVINIATNQSETWYAPSASNPGNIIRRKFPLDAQPKSDVNMSGSSVAVESIYETALSPGSQDESMTLHDYAGMHYRITGTGQVAIVANGLDKVVSVAPLASPITLSGTPGKELLMKWFLRSEQQSIQFNTLGAAAGTSFALSLIRAYYQGSLPQR